MTYCCAFGCSNRSSHKGSAQLHVEKRKKITFHRLPKKPIRQQKWIEAINRNDLNFSSPLFLCSEHFADECFDRTSLVSVRLRDTAVPTIFKNVVKGKRRYQRPNTEDSNKTEGAKYLAEFSKYITDTDSVTTECVETHPVDLQNDEHCKLDIARNEEAVIETVEEINVITAEENTFIRLSDLLQEDNYLDVLPEEEPQIEYDLNNICRVCLQSNDKLLSIDTQFFGADKLYDMIMMCVDITVSEEVKFCKKICLSCAKDLKFVYEFFKQLERSRKLLVEYCSNHATRSENVLKDHDYFTVGSDGVITFEVLENDEQVLIETLASNNHEVIDNEVIKLGDENEVPIMDPSSVICIQIAENKILDSETPSGEKNKSNQCQICNKNFRSMERLTNHICDPKKFTFACSKCNKNMVSIFGLTNHICIPEKVEAVEIAKFEIEKKAPCCGRCNLLFESMEELRKHRTISHNGAKIMTCSICNKSVLARSFKAHKNWHLNQLRKELCEICGKSFGTISQLNQHTKHFHLKLRPFKCDLCDKSFPNKPKLIDHRRIHFDERPFICELCGMSFRQRNCLSRHINMKRCVGSNRPIREIVANHQCIICNLIIFGRKNLVKHMRQAHPIEIGISTERIFKCDQCEESFKTITALKSHSIVHAETRYHCSKCSCVFVSAEKLEVHELRHSEVADKFICEICSKPFLSKQSLNCHMVVHTGERKYSCKYCSKTFKQRSHVALHQRVHTGFKPYKCPYCNKAFTLNGNLTVHIRTHTGEKPYRCEYCDQAFHDSSSAKKHITVKHMIELFEEK